VLWRTADEAGDTLLPSTLVRLLQAQQPQHAAQAQQPRAGAARTRRPPRVAHRGTPAGAQAAAAGRLAATARMDAGRLRRPRPLPLLAFSRCASWACALRPSWSLEVDKRDFGLWLHEVLQRFPHHGGLTPQGEDDAAPRARRWTRLPRPAAPRRNWPSRRHEFLPFDAAWPRAREGDLRWLRGDTAQGMRFQSGETEHRQGNAGVPAAGRWTASTPRPTAAAWCWTTKREPPAPPNSAPKTRWRTPKSRSTRRCCPMARCAVATSTCPMARTAPSWSSKPSWWPPRCARRGLAARLGAHRPRRCAAGPG